MPMINIRFEWTQEMSVNNDVIDSQHQQLFDKINILLTAMIEDRAEHVVDDMVEFFKHYMEEHLQYEEKFLEEIHYPAIDEHKNEHQKFVDKYHELQARLDQTDDKNHLVIEIENFMGSWLTSHILVEDQKYKKYISA